MEGAILALLSELLTQAITQYAKWEIKRKLNNAGKFVSEFYALIDNDGDGVAEHEELVFSFDASVPQSYNGYSLVNNGDEAQKHRKRKQVPHALPRRRRRCL